MNEQVGKLRKMNISPGDPHESEARNFFNQSGLIFCHSMRELLTWLLRSRLQRGTDRFAEPLERCVELTLDVFGSAEYRVQNLLIVLLFDVGENACSRGDKLRLAPLVQAKRRHNRHDENAAGDTGREEQNVGNPIAHSGCD